MCYVVENESYNMRQLSIYPFSEPLYLTQGRGEPRQGATLDGVATHCREQSGQFKGRNQTPNLGGGKQMC